MKNTIYHFQLLNGRTVVLDQDCTFEDIRRLGDTMATEQKHRLGVRSYNTPLRRWDNLGTFLGNRQFQNWDGNRWQINKDYKGMTRMTVGKEVSTV